MRTPAGEKIRTLAGLNAGLLAIFGSNPFRWMQRPLTQGYVPARIGITPPGGGTSSLSYFLIGASSDYLQQGPSVIERVRMQFDIFDLYPSTADQAVFAVEAFINTINLVTGSQFNSVPTTPPNYPNFINLRRDGEMPQTGAVIYTRSLDVTFYNSTLN